MPCSRCRQTLLSADERGDLLVTSSARELLDKVSEVLTREGVQFARQDSVVTLLDVQLLDMIAFVRDLKAFNALECAHILMLPVVPGEPLTFQAFNRARTLAGWFRLLDADDLIKILQRKSFITWFQPILAARTGDVVGYESLLRAERDDGSLMYPDEIFALASDNDLLFQVDRLARVAALRCAARKGVSGTLFINFVPTAIYDPQHCLRTTVRWARQLGFDSRRIVFEVVETEKVADVDHLVRILDFYRESGYLVALDDVGSGYASLKLLAALRPDIIKVDMDIVRGIHGDHGKQAVFRALVGISSDLGIQVLAEGIETEQELAYVVDQGADLVQGFFFARPAADLTLPAASGYWSKG